MDRMEALLLKWLDPENVSLRRNGDGGVPVSELVAMRKARRMGYSEEMILRLAQQSEKLETVGNAVRVRQEDVKSRKIQKLLEFWFGDVNLRRDKFLSRSLRGFPDNMIPLETLLTFNKLKSLETSSKELCGAIEALPSLLKLSEDRTRVGRVAPLPEGDAPEGDADARTIYLEPVPADVTHEKIANIVEKYGKVGYISIPRFENGDAKGFAFVEFESELSVSNCLGGVQGHELHEPLRIISKHEWLQMKEKFKEQKREHRERAKHARQIANIGYSIGVLVKIMGLSDAVKRQDIYEALETLSPVAYVEFKRKTPEICFARFFTAKAAERAAQAFNDGELKIAGRKLIARVLHGREEADKWDEILAETGCKKDEAAKQAGETSAVQHRADTSTSAEAQRGRESHKDSSKEVSVKDEERKRPRTDEEGDSEVIHPPKAKTKRRGSTLL